MMRQPTRTFASIGIDIGKDVFHIVGFDTSGKVVLRKKFKRLAPVGRRQRTLRVDPNSF